jgi:hypothetical protein
MDNATSLDAAHAHMQGAPDDGAVRLQYYERLAEAELYLMLDHDPTDDRIAPSVFPVEGGNFALVFDTAERLAEFSGDITPYAAMSGRKIASLLAGQGIGLGVNLGVAPSSFLIPTQAVDWLAKTLASEPVVMRQQPSEVFAPSGVPEQVLRALDAKLALCAGMAKIAYLAGADYQDAGRAHLLAVIDPLPGAEPAISSAINEALVFCGIEAGSIDVTFLRAHDPVCAKLAKVGLRFDLPVIEETRDPVGAPGMNPDAPPRLR